MNTDYAINAQNCADIAVKALRGAKAALAEEAANASVASLQSRVESIAYLEGYADAAVTIARNAEEVGEERKVKYMTRRVMEGYAGNVHPTQIAATMGFQKGYREACADILDM